MGQTLTHGIYLPDEGERNCYNGLAGNWQLLDGAVGTIAEHSTQIAGKAPAVHTHVKADITDFPAYGNAAGTICEGNDSRLSDARTPVAHTHTKSDVTDLLNSNFIPSSDVNYTLGSSDLRWKQIWAGGYKTKSGNIDLTNSTTTGSAQSWWIDAMEKNGTSFFGVGSIRSHSAGLNEEHFRIKNAGGKWADLYIQLGDNNQFTVGTTTHSDVTNSGFRGKFVPLDSFIPYANNSYDLGSSSYQWNNLYAKNYFYNGTQWGLDKANTWSNENTFSNLNPIILKNSNIEKGVQPTDFQAQSILFKDKNNSNVAYIRHFVNQSGITNFNADGLEFFITNKFANGALDPTGTNTSGTFRIGFWTDGQKYIYNEFRWRSSLIPFNNQTQDIGTSAYQWNNLYAKRVNTQTLNGINPGALSLPDLSDPDPVNTSTWVTDTPTNNAYTPSEDGWLNVVTSHAASANFSVYIKSGNFYASAYSAVGDIDDNTLKSGLFVPVLAGQTYYIVFKGNLALTVNATFYPAKGNV